MCLNMRSEVLKSFMLPKTWERELSALGWSVRILTDSLTGAGPELVLNCPLVVVSNNQC